MNAKFSQSRNDMHWTHYDVADGSIRWTGYDDDYWWDTVSTKASFRERAGKATGRTYTLNPETNEIAVSA